MPQLRLHFVDEDNDGYEMKDEKVIEDENNDSNDDEVVSISAWSTEDIVNFLAERGISKVGETLEDFDEL